MENKSKQQVEPTMSDLRCPTTNSAYLALVRDTFILRWSARNPMDPDALLALTQDRIMTSFSRP